MVTIRYPLPLSADRKTELNFYLVEKGEPDPWAYAKYHCTTASNLYSSVHWSYYPEGDKDGEHS